jgi:hypothetical protein
MRTRYAAALALGLSCGIAAGAELPRLKAGLWEMSTTQPKGRDKATQGMKSCLDDATQKEMMEFSQGMQRQLCTRREMRDEGGRFVTESECKFGGTVVTSRSVTTFSGDSAYRTEVHAAYNPPLAGQKEATLAMEGRHVGACPSGMKPGDIEVAGRRTSLREMREALNKAKK